MKIGILQTGHAPDEIQRDLGDFDALFGKLLDGRGLTFDTFNVVDMDFPDSHTQRDGWLVTGSKHGAYEDHAFIPPLEDFIRKAYADDVPLVGVCFGHQIIAQALGGTVEKFNGGWSVGLKAYDWGNETLHLNAWHQDQVIKRPVDAVVCASNEFCENAALVYGSKAFTVQPHPEFGSDVVAGLAEHRGPGVVPDPLLRQVSEKLAAPNHNRTLAAMIADFFLTRSIL